MTTLQQTITNTILAHKPTVLAGLLPLLLLLPKFLRLVGLIKARRLSLIAHTKERVLILGATSGIGRSLAVLYAQRGASLCIVGRRDNLVNEVVEECQRLTRASVLGVMADFTDVEDVLRVRDTIEKEWGSLDTLAIVAGVSALQPLMDVAQVPKCTGFNPDTAAKATKEGIQRAKDVSNAAVKGNFTGPLVSAVTFIPFLQATSRSPSILLISSPAAVIPAPTRSLYGSTKAASLLLFQALAIEHPRIKFTHVLPGTVEGEFRAGAVDGGPVREKDPNKHGLKKEAVARRAIQAVDEGEKNVFMPWTMRAGHLGYWLAPFVIEWIASKKYNFQA
ncbi:hypothetical protein M378DRAFT_15277 [Amanita muscaria Koide BX008]|uniref:NAD(P)-binding protein n=1 Tax=Amanita muscaria (strain Koide BX008) TaxID=946122 RepID=A0A0C2WQ20_AMAMK|nr:hypothetical protein M378DRAFT_15277 [Amanita muscaria Koide BX008]